MTVPEDFFNDDVVHEPDPGQVKLVLEGIAYCHDGPHSMAGASFWEIPDRVYTSGANFRSGPPIGIATVTRFNNGNLHARVDVVDVEQLVGRPYLAVAVRLPNLAGDLAVQNADPMAGGVLEVVTVFNPVDEFAAPSHSRYRILDSEQHVDFPKLFVDYRRLHNRELNRWEWRHVEDTAPAEHV